MRVITGACKGRKLIRPKVSFIRPTSDRVKEFIFDYLGNSTDKAVILDLFAGTGNLGIEALSRGASNATFIERNFKAYQIIQKNLELTQFTDKSKIIKKDVIQYLAKNEVVTFDLIFADPPYNFSRNSELIEIIYNRNILANKGLFILEHSSKLNLEINLNNLILIKIRKMGDTSVSFFMKNEK